MINSLQRKHNKMVYTLIALMFGALMCISYANAEETKPLKGEEGFWESVSAFLEGIKKPEQSELDNPEEGDKSSNEESTDESSLHRDLNDSRYAFVLLGTSYVNHDEVHRLLLVHMLRKSITTL